jgi:hypothetical protein
MKNLTASAKPRLNTKGNRETRAAFDARMELMEQSQLAAVNRAHQAMEVVDRAGGLDVSGGESSWPEEWKGDSSYRRGAIYAVPDVELSQHSANLGHKNLANMFAECGDASAVKSLCNSANYATLANEERFTASFFSTPLTAYTVGYQDPEDLESLIEFIAPKVVVNRRFEYKLAINKESFYSETDDERAIGGEFPRVEYKGYSNYSKTLNRGLKYRIDLDEEGGGVINEQLIVGRLLQRCRRNSYRRAISALTTLTAGSTTPAPITKVWTNTGQTPAPQPMEDIRTYIQVIQGQAGILPNRVIMDYKSWNLIKASYAAQLTAGAIAMYDIDPSTFATDQGLDGMMVSKAIYTSAVGTQANLIGTKSYVLGQVVIPFFGQTTPGLDDPSNLKRFVTPAGDGDFRVFRQQVGPKFVDISVEYYENTLATATVGMGQLTPS